MANILLCGHRSYAAKNFVALLESADHNVVCFSRGKEERNDNVVTGPVKEIDKNPFLTEELDVIINFILLDGMSLEANMEYIMSLCKLAERKSVLKLVHISSISSYANDEPLITEETPTDVNYHLKGGYGSVKAAIDIFLESKRKTAGFKIVLVRPGFITAPDKKNALSGIAVNLPLGLAVLMGNKQSTLPIVHRDQLQKGLLQIVNDQDPLPVYLMVRKGNNTKYMYFKSISDRKVVLLPKTIIMCLARVLNFIGVFNERRYKMIKGLFKVNVFNADKTYSKIDMYL